MNNKLELQVFLIVFLVFAIDCIYDNWGISE
jgi:hypothetical protein